MYFPFERKIKLLVHQATSRKRRRKKGRNNDDNQKSRINKTLRKMSHSKICLCVRRTFSTSTTKLYTYKSFGHPAFCIIYIVSKFVENQRIEGESEEESTKSCCCFCKHYISNSYAYNHTFLLSFRLFLLIFFRCLVFFFGLSCSLNILFII